MHPSTHTKFCFYLLSMTLFFVIVFILGTDMTNETKDTNTFWENILSLCTLGNIVPLICVTAFVYIGIFVYRLSQKAKGTRQGPIEIKKLQNVNNDILAFVGTYFLPLVSFSLAEKWQHLVVLVLLFVVIGIIYVRADIYYTNPTLLLFGYRVYRLEGRLNGNDIERIVISHGELTSKDLLYYIPIDDNTYYVKKVEQI